MLSKRFINIALVIAIALAFIPFFATGVHATETGAKVVVKTKTVNIKPGKTYKTPIFRLSTKRIPMVPIEIGLSPKDKGKSEWIKKGGYKLSIMSKAGKNMGSYSHSLKYVGFGDECYYSWIYYYYKSLKKPVYPKGKYYFAIKNTTNRIIRVKYSVRAYKEFAKTAELDSNIEMEEEESRVIGWVGPGVPLIESMRLEDHENIYNVYWSINEDGYLSIVPEGTGSTTVYLKLRGAKEEIPFNLTVTGYSDEEEE